MFFFLFCFFFCCLKSFCHFWRHVVLNRCIRKTFKFQLLYLIICKHNLKCNLVFKHQSSFSWSRCIWAKCQCQNNCIVIVIISHYVIFLDISVNTCNLKKHELQLTLPRVVDSLYVVDFYRLWLEFPLSSMCQTQYHFFFFFYNPVFLFLSFTCLPLSGTTQSQSLTSVPIVPSHLPTLATWPNMSASTQEWNPTPAPTAKSASDSSVTFSSTTGKWITRLGFLISLSVFLRSG